MWYRGMLCRKASEALRSTPLHLTTPCHHTGLCCFDHCLIALVLVVVASARYEV